LRLVDIPWLTAQIVVASKDLITTEGLRRIKAVEQKLDRSARNNIEILWINDGDPQPEQPSDEVIYIEWINTNPTDCPSKEAQG